MAIIKLGVTVVGIRGSLGGITFTSSKSGPYAKAWATGSNPKTQKQQTGRSYLSNQAAGWRALTAAQRTAWDAWAALPAQALINSLGVTYYASGYNWFTKCNIRVIRMGASPVVAPPTLARPSAPVINTMLFSITGAPTTGRINYTLGVWTGFQMVIQMQIYNSTGRGTAPSGFKEILLIALPGGTQTQIQTQYQAVFGTIKLGQKGFVRAYKQTTEGDRSAAGSINAIATNT